eukprot:433156-Prymnesium_polylepis.1
MYGEVVGKGGDHGRGRTCTCLCRLCGWPRAHGCSSEHAKKFLHHGFKMLEEVTNQIAHPALRCQDPPGRWPRALF